MKNTLLSYLISKRFTKKKVYNQQNTLWLIMHPFTISLLPSFSCRISLYKSPKKKIININVHLFFLSLSTYRTLSHFRWRSLARNWNANIERSFSTIWRNFVSPLRWFNLLFFLFLSLLLSIDIYIDTFLHFFHLLHLHFLSISFSIYSFYIYYYDYWDETSSLRKVLCLHAVFKWSPLGRL